MSSNLARDANAGTKRSLLQLVVALLGGIAVAFGALVVVPQFADLFEGFATDLPLPTRLLLASYRYWGLAPVLTLAVWLAWPNRVRRGEAAVVFGSLLAGALFVFGVIACYAPIFMLARDAS